MHFPLLQDIVLLLSFSVAIVFFLQRLKLPPILGFLVTGVVIGPYGLSLIEAVHQVELLAEIGVILLLFVIGLELSLKQLAAIQKTVFIGGALQVGMTVAVASLTYRAFGFPWSEAVFVGFLFSLSSTAIVLQVLQDKNEINAPHGRNALAILIFQDIIVVPMMLITPIIAGVTTNLSYSILTLLAKTAVVIVITIISARYVVPRLMYAVAKTRSKELFLLTTMTICFAVAFLTSKAGLSLALGAFLAGLIISESEFSHQATSIILPFRELFTSFFFISVGMLLNLAFFVSNLGPIVLIVLVVFVVKATLAALAVSVLRYSLRTILLTGLSLFQVGEFAFILSQVGIEYGLLTAETNQYFLAVSIVSMLLTPFVILFSDRISGLLLRSRIGQKIEARTPSPIGPDNELTTDHLKGHLVIIGYGVNGSNLARAARFSDISYVVIEFNAKTVLKARQDGIPILFGDAAQEHLLEKAHVECARAVVIAISDREATREIVRQIRTITQTVYLLVRTRFIKEIDEILALGADDVIPEEFETSVEIFSRVMHHFLMPEDDIDHFVKVIRADNYDLFQTQKKLPRTFRPTTIPDFNITCLRVSRDGGKFVGQSLAKLHLRAEHGINILAIARNDEIIDQVGPKERILQHDILYVNGRPEDIERFHQHLH
jgi:monovalent cation:H+ antiporter-2, CPA2 family